MKLLESSDPQTNDGLASGVGEGKGGSSKVLGWALFGEMQGRNSRGARGPGGHYHCPTANDWAIGRQLVKARGEAASGSLNSGAEATEVVINGGCDACKRSDFH